MPWQELVAAVGGEIDPKTGLPAYREVLVTIPRQNGKTTLVLGWEVQRALGWDGPQNIVYSAQSGKDARKKLLDDQVPILEGRRHKLGIRRIIRVNGSEGVEFNNGSRIDLLAGTEASGHGQTIDLGVKDELWHDWDNRRDQALIPAMVTRPAAQMLTVSTMGTDVSIPLNDAVERGRRLVEARDVTSGIAYFEWSADPDEDPDDPATWWRCMPALGHTVTERVVVHARANMPDGEFRRAFLNQKTKADDRVLPVEAWAAVCNDTAAPTGSLVFALDMNPERSAASIVAAAGGVVELVDYRPGVGWLAARAEELNGRHAAARWVVDGGGPAGSLTAELERVGLEVHAVTPAELVKACGQFYDGVMDGTLKVHRHPKLDDAAAAAAKRQVGDAWAWTRKRTAADISPLVAATLGLWGSANLPDPVSVYEDDRGLLVL